MIKLGEIQKLKIIKKVDFGVYLTETGAEQSADGNAGKRDDGDRQVLLPLKEVPEEAEEGGEIRVFVYRDSEDRLIATLRDPLIKIGSISRLKVKEVTRIGAFLDWGLEKDLLLPFHEQTARVKEGETVLAALYVDKSGRLAATMNVYPYLRSDSPYKKGDRVSGTIYDTSENFGVFVAVDDIYSAIVPGREAQGSYRIGKTMEFRVTRVRRDGKLDLSAREKAYKQMDKDAQAVFDIISEQYNGELPFDDKASPEEIKEVFGISKASFKRAVGRLYKERKIELGSGHIVLKK